MKNFQQQSILTLLCYTKLGALQRGQEVIRERTFSLFVYICTQVRIICHAYCFQLVKGSGYHLSDIIVTFRMRTFVSRSRVETKVQTDSSTHECVTLLFIYVCLRKKRR
jgi:hypothetical protein